MSHLCCRLKSISRKMTVKKSFESPVSGLVNAPENELLAMISLDKQVLTDDTDVGQLVLSSCLSILFTTEEHLSNSERPTVYEAVIRKTETRKGQDFIYIHLSTKCIEDLNLTGDGGDVDVEIQFQLNSFLFSKLHEAVDAIKQSSNTRLLFPNRRIVSRDLCAETR